MPTSSQAIAAVAHVLADVDQHDRPAVTMFYRRTYMGYPEGVRALIADFLSAQTGDPSAADLAALKAAVAGPDAGLAEVEAPKWEGPAMRYSPADGQTQGAEDEPMPARAFKHDVSAAAHGSVDLGA